MAVQTFPNICGVLTTGDITFRSGSGDPTTSGSADVAATGRITTPAGSLILDTETFTLDDGNHAATVFEFDKATVQAIAATGQIQAIPAADISDTETFTLDDGIHAARVFEFDKTGAITGGQVKVDISEAITAEEVALLIVNAINGVGPSILRITASINGVDATLVDLVHQVPGAAGNTTSAEAVTDSDFTISDMEDGEDAVFDGVTGGRVAVEFLGTETAIEMGALIEAAINGVGAGLAITATDNEDGTIDLENGAVGVAGNENITDTVANAGFQVEGMWGGSDEGGVPATRPAIYVRTNGEVWVKDGDANEDWTEIT